MKFIRQPRMAAFIWSDRKLAKFLKKPQREIARIAKVIPLFADQIEVAALTPEQEAVRRNQFNQMREQQSRTLAARQWRAGRALLRQLNPEQKTKFFAFWNKNPMYQRAEFLRSFIEMFNGEAERKIKKIECEQADRRAHINAHIKALQDADMFRETA